MNQFRHGDVFLEAVEQLPKDAKEVRKGDIVLAYGEVTGHMHQIDSRGATVVEWEAAGQRYITIEGGRDLVSYRREGSLPNHFIVADDGGIVPTDEAIIEEHHQTGVVLTHEEHGPMVLEPGTYAFRQLNVYEDEEVRPVAD